MKFGRFLADSVDERYLNYCMNYKYLKKLIEKIKDPDNESGKTAGGVFSNITTIQELTREVPEQVLSDEFFIPGRFRDFQEALDIELQKVNSVVDLDYLSLSKRIKVLADLTTSDSNTHTHHHPPSREALGHFISDVVDDIGLLDRFIRLNLIGFRKITKKFDKQTSSASGTWFMTMLSRSSSLVRCDTGQLIDDLNKAACNAVKLVPSPTSIVEVPKSGGHHGSSSFFWFAPEDFTHVVALMLSAAFQQNEISDSDNDNAPSCFPVDRFRSGVDVFALYFAIKPRSSNQLLYFNLFLYPSSSSRIDIELEIKNNVHVDGDVGSQDKPSPGVCISQGNVAALLFQAFTKCQGKTPQALLEQSMSLPSSVQSAIEFLSVLFNFEMSSEKNPSAEVSCPYEITAVHGAKYRIRSVLAENVKRNKIKKIVANAVKAVDDNVDDDDDDNEFATPTAGSAFLSASMISKSSPQISSPLTSSNSSSSLSSPSGLGEVSLISDLQFLTFNNNVHEFVNDLLSCVTNPDGNKQDQQQNRYNSLFNHFLSPVSFDRQCVLYVRSAKPNDENHSHRLLPIWLSEVTSMTEVFDYSILKHAELLRKTASELDDVSSSGGGLPVWAKDVINSSSSSSATATITSSPSATRITSEKIIVADSDMSATGLLSHTNHGDASSFILSNLATNSNFDKSDHVTQAMMYEAVASPWKQRITFRSAIVKVEPKTFFASDRLLLDWLSTSFLIATNVLFLMQYKIYTNDDDDDSDNFIDTQLSDGNNKQTIIFLSSSVSFRALSNYLFPFVGLLLVPIPIILGFRAARRYQQRTLHMRSKSCDANFYSDNFSVQLLLLSLVVINCVIIVFSIIQLIMTVRSG
jgi:hypothetical protein